MWVVSYTLTAVWPCTNDVSFRRGKAIIDNNIWNVKLSKSAVCFPWYNLSCLLHTHCCLIMHAPTNTSFRGSKAIIDIRNVKLSKSAAYFPWSNVSSLLQTRCRLTPQRRHSRRRHGVTSRLNQLWQCSEQGCRKAGLGVGSRCRDEAEMMDGDGAGSKIHLRHCMSPLPAPIGN